ncbi:4-oxalocrotonate tautomerase DmpI [uncultured Cloacibacillus sp.]|uniref:4-oxalocrotonate tautomerase DmpI n=1 Tax=uncultured Cloacibacillus sp. TaxID=889794 RepID=UPI0025E06951|nr:4-oxalocrotonate tautomerase DmpI [uncultured Cloacibacillus sp.]
MPAITVEAAKLTKEQKTQLIAELTESASKILRLPKDIIFVFLKENDPDNIGASGLPLSAHGKPAEKNQ